MNSISWYFIVLLFSLSLTCSSASTLDDDTNNNENLVECLYQYSNNSTSTSKLVYTKSNSSYSSVLQFSIQNLRFETNTTSKPLVIVTPSEISQIQATIICSKRHGMQIRTRSGGHDYEGLSYVSEVPFVIIDLINLSEIHVDADNRTAWVQAGATIGEDLFWAIRGGGGASFGVIISWKIQLVTVPSTVTVFRVARTLEQNATELVHKWHLVANKLDDNLTIRIILQRLNSSSSSNKQGSLTVQATFESMFLGTVEELIPLVQERFPELGLLKQDCSEMSWIQSVLYLGGFSSNESPQVLLNRTQSSVFYFKGKSDYVTVPIPESGVEGLWPLFYEDEAQYALMIFNPYGGRMDEIPESEIPFPHRAGNICKIQHIVYWVEEGDDVAERHMNWIRRVYSYMEPFVSKSPRAAYVNYRDLDIGVNNKNGYTSYKKASVWGLKYFKNNFNRLVHVKTKVDPLNFFRNEQSIPSLLPLGRK
ncbi:hypothetical protein Ahy_B03g062112 [Arachis hypogaea]|uniref:FAD-binding PCMH-type domain-containing protein n=1 Tax=Arachis hypogaea TaxID=3818 RepID=A0A444ZTC8_ARAHY|nr:hypothetical protein Ahy_B03g062112 [Arachis hypogaea]